MSTTIGGPSRGGAPPAEHESPAPAAGSDAPGSAAGDASAPRTRRCKKCGTELAPSQDWCLKCGAAAPGSIDLSRWRPSALVTALVLLACGAAAVAYAALNQHASKPRAVTRTLAVTTAPAAPAGATTTTTRTAPPASPAGKAKLPIPLVKSKLPKIPLTAITPPASKSTGKQTPSSSTPATKTGASGATGAPAASEGGSGAEEASEPAALVLDTNAATTYNPYDLPAADFGDPSLTIDGDPATAWTAQLDPATAPAMAEGVLLDLKTRRQLAALKLVTDTPGMTVQVYGSEAASAPDTILSSAWTVISAPVIPKKRDTLIQLRAHKQGFRLVVLWISKAPADQVGTAQAPGHVAVNELELFPAS